jgi:hypothetical protein
MAIGDSTLSGHTSPQHNSAVTLTKLWLNEPVSNATVIKYSRKNQCCHLDFKFLGEFSRILILQRLKMGCPGNGVGAAKVRNLAVDLQVSGEIREKLLKNAKIKFTKN